MWGINDDSEEVFRRDTTPFVKYAHPYVESAPDDQSYQALLPDDPRTIIEPSSVNYENAALIVGNSQGTMDM